MSALRELFATFEIAFDAEGALDKGAKKVDSLVDKLTFAAKAFAGFKLVEGVIAWGEHVAEAAREVEFGAIKAGMGVDEFQRLNVVAQRYGSTAEQLTISTRLFIRGISDAHGTMGEFGTKTNHAQHALHVLGIDAAQFKGKGLAEILPVIADGFQKLGQGTTATAVGLRLFGHRGIGILPLMFQGGDKFRKEMEAALPVFEELTIEKANDASLSVQALSQRWQHLIVNIFGRPLLEAMSKGADALTRVTKAVEELMKKSEIGKAFFISLTAALVAGAVAIIAAWWPVLLPILAVTAGFAFLVGLVDDFIVFMEGGKSVIGRFFNELLGEGGAEKARNVVKGLWDDFKGLMEDLKDPAFKLFVEGMKLGFEAIAKTLHLIKDLVIWLKENLADPSMKALDKLFHLVPGGGSQDTVKGPVGTAQSSAFVNPGLSIAPPPVIGPPTAAQSAAFGPPAAGGAPIIHMPIHGNIDSVELVEKVKHTVNQHNTERFDGILRDSFAAAGGSK